MRGKLIFIAGAAVGFVLGSRQGRQAYDRIKTKAADVWTDPKVRDNVAKAADLAKDKLPGGDKIAAATRKAADKADEAAQEAESSEQDGSPQQSDAQPKPGPSNQG